MTRVLRGLWNVVAVLLFLAGVGFVVSAAVM